MPGAGGRGRCRRSPRCGAVSRPGWAPLTPRNETRTSSPRPARWSSPLRCGAISRPGWAPLTPQEGASHLPHPGPRNKSSPPAPLLDPSCATPLPPASPPALGGGALPGQPLSRPPRAPFPRPPLLPQQASGQAIVAAFIYIIESTSVKIKLHISGGAPGTRPRPLPLHKGAGATAPRGREPLLSTVHSSQGKQGPSPHPPPPRGETKVATAGAGKSRGPFPPFQGLGTALGGSEPGQHSTCQPPPPLAGGRESCPPFHPFPPQLGAGERLRIEPGAATAPPPNPLRVFPPPPPSVSFWLQHPAGAASLPVRFRQHQAPHSWDARTVQQLLLGGAEPPPPSECPFLLPAGPTGSAQLASKARKGGSGSQLPLWPHGSVGGRTAFVAEIDGVLKPCRQTGRRPHVSTIAALPGSPLPANPALTEGNRGTEGDWMNSGALTYNKLQKLTQGVERLGNATAKALGLLNDQTSQMRKYVIQNRLGLEYLLAKEGGSVCHPGELIGTLVRIFLVYLEMCLKLLMMLIRLLKI